MQIFKAAQEIREFSRKAKREGKTVGFVPTMGFLHEGHLSLVKIARDNSDVVIASIYVNPTQFAAHEDFDVYPRDVDGDRQKLEDAGCAAVFEPDTLYAGTAENQNVVGAVDNSQEGHQTFVQVEGLQKPLCGKSRPHFFRGVATVVTKLFNIVEPDVAVFGLKDYQQYLIITKMVKELDFPIKIIGGDISREKDGLAMSSRNARLHPDARPKAVVLYDSLEWAKQSAKESKEMDAKAISDEIHLRITNAGGTLDYIEVVHAHTLQPIANVESQPTLIALAVHFPAKDGTTVRLIDNTVIQ